MRILFVSPRPLFPPTEGFSLRAANLARILAQQHIVDLLFLSQDGEQTSTGSEMEGVFRRVISFPHSRFTAYTGSFRSLLSQDPLQVGYYRNREAEDWIREHQSEYDCFFLSSLRMLPSVEGFPQEKIIDSLDAVSRIYRMATPYASGLWRLLYTIESKRMPQYECHAIKTSTLTLVSAEADRSYFISLGAEPDKLVVVPNGIREELLSFPEKQERGAIVFFGRMNYFPNVDAVTWFAQEIFPSLRARIPDLEFLVIGPASTPRVQSLRQIPGVQVLGFLENPYPVIASCKIVVCPLRIGSGIQNKVLESMAISKCVVTTPIGNQGIGAQDGREIIVAKNAAEFTDAVFHVLKDPAKRHDIGKQARNFVSARFRWDMIGEELLSRITLL